MIEYTERIKILMFAFMLLVVFAILNHVIESRIQSWKVRVPNHVKIVSCNKHANGLRKSQ